MKKLIQWLAKVFKADIIKTITIYKDRIIYKSLDEITSGDITVEGNILVDGSIEASKDIICYKSKTNEE